jgi:hypothetical protein
LSRKKLTIIFFVDKNVGNPYEEGILLRRRMGDTDGISRIDEIGGLLLEVRLCSEIYFSWNPLQGGWEIAEDLHIEGGVQRGERLWHL